MDTLCSDSSLKNASRRLNYEQLQARLEREVRAREAAEQLLEHKSLELFRSNQSLELLAQNLDSHRQQLNTILDHTLAGIFLVNQNLDVVQVNRAGRRLFGLNRDEDVLELSFVSLFEDAKNTKSRILDLISKDCETEDLILEAVGLRFDDTTFPLEFAVSRVQYRGNPATVWIVRDITRRKKEEERRKAAEKELSHAQKLEALGTLSSGVAHEINTPIQYIGDNVRFSNSGFSDVTECIALYQKAVSVLRAEGSNKELVCEIEKIENLNEIDYLISEIPQALEQTIDGVDQVARIVRAIKEFSHPGDAEMSEVCINETIETTATVCRNTWKYAADLSFDLDPHLPKVVCAAGDISQILLNLISNSVDAINERPDRTNGAIKIRSFVENKEEVAIEISDNGVGIPQSIQQRIFDPFFTTKEVGKGTGQGLAITNNIIVNKYGGRLTCKSKEGFGTVMVIHIPTYCI